MPKNTDRYIPVFPLPMLLFPGEEIPLHIFEPRYKQLIKDCINGGITFGIPYVRGSSLEQFGSEVRLKRVLKTYHDDSMDITVEALKLFKITRFDEFMHEKLYGAGKVEDLPEPDFPVVGSFREKFIDFQKRFNRQELSDSEVEGLTTLQLAAQAGFSSDQKMEILNLQHPKDQLSYIYRELQLLYRIREMEQESKDKFQLN